MGKMIKARWPFIASVVYLNIRVVRNKIDQNIVGAGDADVSCGDPNAI